LSCGCLNRIENVYTNLDKIINEREDIAIRMEKDFGFCAFFDELDKISIKRF